MRTIQHPILMAIEETYYISTVELPLSILIMRLVSPQSSERLSTNNIVSNNKRWFETLKRFENIPSVTIRPCHIKGILRQLPSQISAKCYVKKRKKLFSFHCSK